VRSYIVRNGRTHKADEEGHPNCKELRRSHLKVENIGRSILDFKGKGATSANNTWTYQPESSKVNRTLPEKQTHANETRFSGETGNYHALLHLFFDATPINKIAIKWDLRSAW